MGGPRCPSRNVKWQLQRKDGRALPLQLTVSELRDAQGRVRFRTIRPVPYPGRTPHIHVKLRHGSFGELTSQLFVKDDAGNTRDFLWRAVPAAEREALEMQLHAAEAGSGLRWVVRHALVVPA